MSTQESGWRTPEALRRANPTHGIFPGGISYFDLDDPAGHLRPLIDMAIGGYWHATGWRTIGGGKPPRPPEVVPPDWWEFLTLNVETDTASGGGIEFTGLRWYDCPPPEEVGDITENPPLRSDQKDKQDMQEAARKLWQDSPAMTQTDVIDMLPDPASGRAYRHRTLIKWVGEVDPRPAEKRRGRPRNK